MFEYKNYHFKPVGNLKGNFYKISKKIKSGFLNNYKNKTNYNYKDFYAASGSTDDLFYCFETKKIYIPANNELFEFLEN